MTAREDARSTKPTYETASNKPRPAPPLLRIIHHVIELAFFRVGFFEFGVWPSARSSRKLRRKLLFTA